MIRIRSVPAITAMLLSLAYAAPPADARDARCGQGPGMMRHHGMGMGMGMMGGSRARHRYAMHHGLEPEYAGLANPFPAAAGNIEAGKTLFAQNCARCHGATGRGDGEAGRDLQPRPADLTRAVRMPMASDGYLYWTISEGGAAFGTGMPAWKDALKASDIWKIVLYLRTLPAC